MIAVTQLGIWKKRLWILASDTSASVSGWIKVVFLSKQAHRKQRNTSLCPSPVQLSVLVVWNSWSILGPNWWKFCATRLVTVSILKSLLERVPPLGTKHQPGSSILYLSSLYFPSEEISNSCFRSCFSFHEMMEALVSLGIRSIRMQRNVLVS